MGGKLSCTKTKTKEKKNAFQFFRYKKNLMGKTWLCKEKLWTWIQRNRLSIENWKREKRNMVFTTPE